MVDPPAQPLRYGSLAIAMAVITAVVVLPGLGDYGLWSEAELPVVNRARAALGAPLSDLVRSPWVPDRLRTLAYGAFPGAFGLRLPHALATIALVTMTGVLGRLRGATVAQSLLTGGLVLAFPMVSVAGRSALGNPVGEMFSVGTVLFGLIALHASSRRRAGGLAIISLGFATLSVASAGLALGGVLPIGALAIAVSLRPHHPRMRWIAMGLWLLWGTLLITTIALSWSQHEGYIPLLGAAKDLTLVDKPEQRRFAAGLEDLGYGLYPWGPLCLAGALLARDRWAAAWLGLGLCVTGGWGLVYGSTPLPVAVPAALCARSALAWMLHPCTERVTRRLFLAIIVLGMLVIHSDAQSTPARVTLPIHRLDGERAVLEQRVNAPESLGRISAATLWALLAVGLLSPSGGRPHRLDRRLDRLPPARREAVALGLVGAAALSGALGYAHHLVPTTLQLFSPRQILARHHDLAAAHLVPSELAIHQVRDPGLQLDDSHVPLALFSRRDLTRYLSADQPRVALIRERDLPALHQDHRHKGWPLYVLDDSHAHLRLVANRLPEGERDLNPIPTVLFDQAPSLAHPTQVQFEQSIEIIGWELTDPIVRGRRATLKLAIRVLAPLPGGSQLYARLLKGRSSRLSHKPQELTGGVYPPNLWREGDYILHSFTFKAPLLEIQPGLHELIVGLRRNERQNFEITIPEGRQGTHGVRIRGSKRNFATIGTVPVW